MYSRIPLIVLGNIDIKLGVAIKQRVKTTSIWFPTGAMANISESLQRFS